MLPADVQRIVALFASGGTVSGVLSLQWPLEAYRTDPLLADAILQSAHILYDPNKFSWGRAWDMVDFLPMFRSVVFWTSAAYASCTPQAAIQLCHNVGMRLDQSMQNQFACYLRAFVGLLCEEEQKRGALVVKDTEKCDKPSVIGGSNPILSQAEIRKAIDPFDAAIRANKPVYGFSELDVVATNMLLAAAIGFRACQTIPCIRNNYVQKIAMSSKQAEEIYTYVCATNSADLVSTLAPNLSQWPTVINRAIGGRNMEHIRRLVVGLISIDNEGLPLISLIRGQETELEKFVIDRISQASSSVGLLRVIKVALEQNRMELCRSIIEKSSGVDLVVAIIRGFDAPEFIKEFNHFVVKHRKEAWDSIFGNKDGAFSWDLGARGIALLRDPVIGPSDCTILYKNRLKIDDKWKVEVLAALAARARADNPKRFP